MPGPPPPPPPMAPPPPMPSSSFLHRTTNGDNERNALLKSIRAGRTLKKTVTNDKSAPLIAGKTTNNYNNNNGNSNGSANVANNASPNVRNISNGLNLGELFAGGIPKLRPTGKLDTPNVNIQNELKKQMATDSRNRGPPPPAPVRTNQQPPPPQVTRPSTNGQSAPNRPVTNHGKPNLAPKPPSLQLMASGKMTKKMGSGGTTPTTPNGRTNLLNRTQSMKSPHSLSTPALNSNNASTKFGTVRHLSSMLNQNNHMPSRPSLSSVLVNGGRPSAPPPAAPPPPPPSSAVANESERRPGGGMLVRPPNHAPPPPPPPPQSTANRILPNSGSNGMAAPPPPPPRHSSMRNDPSNNLSYSQPRLVDFDRKFKFQPTTMFPKPPPFRHCLKLYTNRQANKQQAPQPPSTHHQSRHLHHQIRNMTSTSTC